MKKKLLFTITVLLVLAMSISSYAAVTVSTQQGSVIVIEGAVPSRKSGVNVTVQVLKNANSINQLDVLTLNETSIYVDQVLSSNDGKYRFEIYLPATIEEGQFDVLVGENKPYPVQNVKVKYVSVAKIKEAMLAINAASVASTGKRQQMENALKTTFLGLDVTKCYDDYTNMVNKEVMLDLLITYIQSDPLKTASDNDIKASSGRIKELYILATGIGAISNGVNEQAVDELLIKYQNDVGINLIAYEALDNGTFGIGKKSVCATIMELHVKTPSDLQTAINKGQVLAELNEAISWSNVKATIEGKGSVIELQMGASSTYATINDKTELYKYIAKSVPFSSLAEVISTFNTGVAVQKSPEVVSGGGSKSGSSGSVAPPVQNVEIKVEIPEPNKVVRFSDIEQLPWAVEAIDALADKGAISGDASGVFSPNRNITRSEFIKIMLIAFSIEEKKGDINFSDVASDNWYYSYIKTAFNAGIVSGQSKDYFAPEENITRQDMAVIVAKAARYKGINLIESKAVAFTDEGQISDYALGSIYSLARSGIINGVADGKFEPMENATRAQAAKIIYGVIKK